MPGIVGLITKKSPDWAAPRLARMVRSMCHESFYTTGTWTDQSSGVYVGWVERTGSAGTEMSLLSKTQDVALAFSGEDFSDAGVDDRRRRAEAERPSYLVQLYEEDPSFPSCLNGRFHGLARDRNRGTVVLFNDRYGMHRIYCHEAPDVFYFAAEAKAILTVLPELRRLDSRSLGEFIASGAVLQNRTLFEGIQALPPAARWVFRNGALETKGTYFQPGEWEEQEKLDRNAYPRELHEVFARNLPRYCEGDEPVAMSLTGGLDSRIILASRPAAPGSLPCYTFGSMFRENRDVYIARRLARLCGQPHHVILAGQEFLRQFPRYAERAIYLSDGCVDVGRSPDLYLNEKAREISPVRLAGTYGGELLRGVRAFKTEQPVAGLFQPEMLHHILGAEDTYKKEFLGHPVSLAAFKLCPWALNGILALEQTQLGVRTPFLDNDFVRTIFRSSQFSTTDSDISMQLIGEGNPALLKIPTDRGLAGNFGRISGAAYRGALEFLFKAEYASDMGMPQWLARFDHLSPIKVEHLFLGRHKAFHFRVWYRDALAGYVKEMLLDERALSRPYIQRKGLEAIVHGHVKGNRNYTNDIHRVLTLEILHRLFLDEAGPRDGDEVPGPIKSDQFTTA